MKLLINIIYLFLIALTLLSCNDNNLVEPIINISNDTLYNFAYYGKQWPEGFYQEDSMEGSIYYENTISIKPLNERKDIWIELCTDNIDTARTWSELSSKYSSYYRDLASERETERYYEFKRVYSANNKDILLSRVHKRSYLDRSMYDYFKREGIIGIFNKNNFNQNDVKELIEYIWFAEHYQIGGKVYKSITEKNDSEFIHYIYEVEIVYGDFGVNDIINYYKNTFYVKINNGEITHKRELIKQIKGK